MSLRQSRAKQKSRGIVHFQKNTIHIREPLRPTWRRSRPSTRGRRVSEAGRISFAFGWLRVKEIGDDAFVGCSNLEEVDLGNVVKIGKWAFYNCKGLVSIHLPCTVNEIGDVAFCGCSALAEVELCEGLRKIGRRAFALCYALTFAQFKLPNAAAQSNAATIGDSAFRDCGSLKVVTFGEAIHYIEKDAFRGCSPKKITIPPNSFAIDLKGHDGRFVRGRQGREIYVPGFSCRFVKKSTIDYVYPDGQIIASGKLGVLSPHRLAEVQGRINNIMGRQNESKEEKLELIRRVIGHFKMVEVTTNLVLAIRKANIDARGNHDVESISSQRGFYHSSRAGRNGFTCDPWDYSLCRELVLDKNDEFPGELFFIAPTSHVNRNSRGGKTPARYLHLLAPSSSLVRSSGGGGCESAPASHIVRTVCVRPPSYPEKADTSVHGKLLLSPASLRLGSEVDAHQTLRRGSSGRPIEEYRRLLARRALVPELFPHRTHSRPQAILSHRRARSTAPKNSHCTTFRCVVPPVPQNDGSAAHALFLR
ncbi:hypothetical protein ACHAWF_014839 [Thalassiosira exigua]